MTIEIVTDTYRQLHRRVPKGRSLWSFQLTPRTPLGESSFYHSEPNTLYQAALAQVTEIAVQRGAKQIILLP